MNTAIRERPILMSGPMVRAILSGRKTETRRVVKGVFPAPPPLGGDCVKDWDGGPSLLELAPRDWEICPFGVPGDRLWVREAAYIAPPNFADPADATHRDAEGRPRVVSYAASMDGDAIRCAEDYGVRQRPSIFMPRWASRLTLEIRGVRVERLQSISEDDAFREGFDCQGYYCDESVGHVDCGGVRRFRELWDQINGKRAPWTSNPWVWAISFLKAEK